MSIRSLPILLFVCIVVLSRQEVMAAATDEKKILSDTSSIVNIGAGGISSTIPKTPGSAAQFIADNAAFSEEMLKRGNDRDTLYADLSNRGTQLIGQCRYYDAACVFKEAIAVKPHLSHAYVCLAGAYFHLGRYDECIETSKISLVLTPNIASSYSTLGDAYSALGKRAEAKANYKRALEIFRKDGNLAAVKKMEESLSEYDPSLNINIE
ncbi:MAG: tetratricopeptide repeat protein [Candidatus Omnitrophota bacterium]|jgi:tetratricopeptide (TPR) repeat protein